MPASFNQATVVSVLKTVHDPEIPVDIYELGLIYEVTINEDSFVHIEMTLTSPNCPVAESLPAESTTRHCDGRLKPQRGVFRAVRG